MTLALHDASTGFHDIKPLPVFSPMPVDVIFIAVAALLVFAFICYLYFRKCKQQEAPPPPPLPPDQIALQELKRLDELREQGKIELRVFASDLSLIVRTYLENVLHFPAREQTRREVEDTLPPVMKKTLPQIEKDKHEDIQYQVRSLLGFCERATFAQNAETSYSLGGETLIAQPKKAEQVIRNIAYSLKREKERTASVIASSKLAQTQSPSSETVRSSNEI